MSRDKDYGKCDLCGEPFGYGDTFIELRIQRCGQSQGYETLWQQGQTVQVHQRCFKDMLPSDLTAIAKV